jgi:hypothetical protein
MCASDFDGLAANVVRDAKASLVTLVKTVLPHFPGNTPHSTSHFVALYVSLCFIMTMNTTRLTGIRATVVCKGARVHFYKRAQILVGDIWAAYGRPVDPLHPYFFHDIAQLTMFADYRVPQILRHMGVLPAHQDWQQLWTTNMKFPVGQTTRRRSAPPPSSQWICCSKHWPHMG